eukprot:4610654-Prymnesium_polylepis.1
MRRWTRPGWQLRPSAPASLGMARGVVGTAGAPARARPGRAGSRSRSQALRAWRVLEGVARCRVLVCSGRWPMLSPKA